MRTDLLSFDIEIWNDIPEGTQPDLHDLIPSVAALATDVENVEYFYDKPFMNKSTSVRLVSKMLEYSRNGYRVFGWNIVSFDFPILAYYSGMIDECAKLTLDCIDPMFIVVCKRGHFLGLDTALVGNNIETKLHNVTLNDGTTLHNMNGSLAPKLFRDGEYQAVLDYLAYDVWQPLKLGFSIDQKGGIVWTSKSGKRNFLPTKLISTKECLEIEKPDTSWMTNPPDRDKMISWIPKEILLENGLEEYIS